MGYLITDNGHIYYEVEGNGFPLVFIHGLGLSHVNWRPQVVLSKVKTPYSSRMEEMNGI